MADEGKAGAEVPSDSATAEVAEWLTTMYKGGRRAALADKLPGVDGEDLHGYSEAQLKDICGKAWGTALYNVLHPSRELRLLGRCSSASSAEPAAATAACTGSTSRVWRFARCCYTYAMLYSARRRSAPDSATRVAIWCFVLGWALVAASAGGSVA